MLSSTHQTTNRDVSSSHLGHTSLGEPEQAGATLIFLRICSRLMHPPGIDQNF